MRLDSYLAEHWPEFSRSQWQRFITLGYVTVDGKVVTSSKVTLSEDSEVAVHLPERQTYDKQTLPVVYEDDNVVVINKPSGVLTHAKGESSEEFSVAEFVPRSQS
jgi:23S rRNA pseudouridine1911/1915/1917 synthase